MGEEQKVKCKFKFSEDYNPKYVNGAYGGLSPRGELVINFFLERYPVPNSQTFKISADGEQVEEIQSEMEPQDLNSSTIRMVENGIIIDYNFAKELQRWLDVRIAEWEKEFE